MERDQAGSGFTVLVLCLAAILSKTTNQTVKTALESVSAEQVRVWQKKNLGQSIQAKRKEALRNENKEPSQNKQNNVAVGNNNQEIFDKRLSNTTLLIQTTQKNNNQILIGKRQEPYPD